MEDSRVSKPNPNPNPSCMCKVRRQIQRPDGSEMGDISVNFIEKWRRVLARAEESRRPGSVSIAWNCAWCMSSNDLKA